MPATVPFWNAERDEVLRRLAADGKNSVYIASVLGCRRALVRARARRLGIDVKWCAVSRWIVDPRLAAYPRSPYAYEACLFSRFKVGYKGQMPKVSIAGLESWHCRFPIDTDVGVLYCGDRKIAGSVYCEVHSNRCEINRHR